MGKVKTGSGSIPRARSRLSSEGVPGEVIRFVFLSTHYRKPMDWSERKRRDAEATLRRWYGQAIEGRDGAEPDSTVVNALANDLNTAGAIAELHRLSRTKRHDDLRASLRFLGLMGAEAPSWAADRRLSSEALELVERLLKERADARAAKDFARADALRDGFASAGLIVRDTPDGAVWDISPDFTLAELEALQ